MGHDQRPLVLVPTAIGDPADQPARRPQQPGVVADGTSCRQQIRDGAGRRAMHVARVLESALAKTDVQ